MDTPNAFGLSHVWAQGDVISHAVFILLVAMSIASWYLILGKALRLLFARRHVGAIEQFWNASSLDDGLEQLDARAADAPCARLAHQAAAAHAHCARHAGQSTLGAALNADEFVTRALRRSIAESTARLESGLTVLASIGSTAPFVGLLGTVWGIYHALTTISASGAASIETVAGPVGEALIMTAFGLFVAIPAVLAYNGFSRANRVELSELDGFAHDLHVYFTTGTRVVDGRPARAPARQAGVQPLTPSSEAV